jgi:tRNA pseudouridine55 synthase
MINGVLNIHKEKGYTSHDVVAKLRGIVGQKKIGHTGTLDPDATGVLPVCLGKATKLCDMLTDKSKTYETVMLLGKTTDTQDISGEVLKEEAYEHLTTEEVERAILSFVGEYAQIPPMYSALKVNGKKLYELAREGIEVERKARPITIHSIQIKELDLPRVRMEVYCSKGTYIRTLCNDIGEKLGCGACMEELLRTKVSCFTLANSLTLAEVQKMKEDGRLEEILTSIDSLFLEYPAVTLKEEFQPLVFNGNTFLPKHLKERVVLEDGLKIRVYDDENRFIAIYRFDKEKYCFKIEKMFFEREDNAVH